MDPCADVETALIGLVDILLSIDVEGDVLDAHLVVVVLTTVGLPERDELIAPAQVGDVLGSPIGPVDVLVFLPVGD